MAARLVLRLAAFVDSQSMAVRAAWSVATVASCLKPMLPSSVVLVSTERTSASVASSMATSVSSAKSSEAPRWCKGARVRKEVGKEFITSSR
ncbi:hypothetical protein D9M72_601690 [compost metagenome]